MLVFSQLFKECSSGASLGASSTGECTVTCGGGTQNTTQTCIAPRGCSVDQSVCEGDQITTSPCNQEEVGSLMIQTFIINNHNESICILNNKICFWITSLIKVRSLGAGTQSVCSLPASTPVSPCIP